MANRLTPIELAIAGEPTDRKQRYARNLIKRGFVRVTVMVPNDRADELRAIAKQWVDGSRRDDD